MAAGVLCLAALVPCAAAASGFSGGAGLLSDKVVRGLSQSDGEVVAVADGVYRADNGWALSAGAATLGRRHRRGAAEVSAGGGIGGEWGDQADATSWQLAASHYVTLGRPGGGGARRPDYDEALASASWRGWRAAVTVSPNYLNPQPGTGPRRGTAVYAELTWHRSLYPLLPGWALDAGFGHADYRQITLGGYRYGNVGLSWSHGALQLSASRIFSTSGSPTAARPRALLSALVSF